MKNKVFIDCGAHCGESIIEAKQKFGNDIKIISYEANTNLYKELCKFFKNDLNVEIFNKAVWKEDGKIKIYISNQWSDGSSIYKEKISGGINENVFINVESVDISSYIKNNFTAEDYIILKLDVEGAEYEILNKMIDDGTINMIDELYGEFHSDKILNNSIEKLETKISKYFIENNIQFKNWELVNSKNMVIDRNIWKQKMNTELITFVIPSRNNLDFLKLAYKSIKDLENNHFILILDDASTDGTAEWINSLKDDHILTYTNVGPDRIGIVGMFDKGVELAKTDIIFAFHADMIASPNLDINILKYLKEGTVVCATRVEPPLHPAGPEKITLAMGNDTSDLNYSETRQTLARLENKFDNKTTEGIFAPWCMYKKDYLAVGGHDILFAPQSKEDSDLFNRFVLKGYKLIQSWSGLVYHFTSRGSRFNKYSGGDIGKNSAEWLLTNEKNTKNFIRKWGTFVEHDINMRPTITPKYDICLILTNCNKKYIDLLEPYCSSLYVDCSYDEFLAEEQKNTIINLKNKFIQNKEHIDNNILVYLNCEEFNDKIYNAIINLPKIITKNINGKCDFTILNSLKIQVREFKQIKIQ